MAQTGSSMKLMAPVVLGQTASMVMEYPPALAGRQFAMAVSSPSYPGELLMSGGIVGVLRLDPLAYAVLGVGVLDASGVSPALTFPVPNDPLLVGASFDVQGADIDGAGLITLTDNDLEIEVAAPPPASLNMVAIAAGTFQMGSTAVGGSALPVHAVTITRPFWMGKFEVTQAGYQAVVGSNPSYHQGPSYPNSASRPVEQVTWPTAVAFCVALTVQEAAAGRLASGYEYRLPTEAEWEYCCRAGTTTEWSFGTSLSCFQANHLSSFYCVPGLPPYGGQTNAVANYAANAFGLHGMHGNVWEWCLDSWGGGGYAAGAVADPYGTTGSARIIRGGSWGVSANLCRYASRAGSLPSAGGLLIGFRVVCAPVLP